MKESQSVCFSGGFGQEMILSDLFSRSDFQDRDHAGLMYWLHTKSLSLGFCNESVPKGPHISQLYRV